MRTHTYLSHSISVLAFLAGTAIALGQTSPPLMSPDHPKFYVWGPDGVPCGVEPRPTDFQTAMVKLAISADMTPLTAATLTADYIMQHTRAHVWDKTLNWGQRTDCHGSGVHPYPDLGATIDEWPSTICISIQNFGNDSKTIDIPNSDPALNWAVSPLRFFTEDDRLPDYIGGSYNTDDASFGFPQLDPDLISSRNFRHPFLWNAGFNDTVSHPAPLRVWMEQYIAAYKNLRDTNPQYDGLPDPRRFYFDTEVFLTWFGTIVNADNQGDGTSNCVQVLRQIWASRFEDTQFGTHTNYWSGVPVPGDLDGYSLRDAYLRDAAEFNLPTFSSGDEAGEPDLSLLRSRNTDGTPRSGAHESNRKFMLWWTEVCNRAVDKVMKHSLYDVVQAAWPSTTIQVGNYNYSRNDGTPRESGVVQDTSCNGSDNTAWVADYVSRVTTTGTHPNQPRPETAWFRGSMPSCTRIGGVDSAGMWHITDASLPDGIWGSERRWGSVVSWAFGDIDSPVLYPLPESDDAFLKFRHLNPYAAKDANGKNLPELRHEASMRWYREAVEATVPGYRANADGRLLVPWIAAMDLPIDGGWPTPRLSAGELAQLLGMLRGKRIQEAIIFNSLPFLSEEAASSWKMTERAISDVYAPVIISVAVTDNTRTEAPLSSSEYEKLNDTLRGSGDARGTVDLTSKYDAVNNKQIARLKVVFDDRYRGSAPSGMGRLVDPPSTTPPTPRRDFLVNLEAQTLTPGGLPHPNAYMEMNCRRTNNTGFLLPTFDGQSSASANRNPMGETRCYWTVPNAIQDPSLSRIDPSVLGIDIIAPGNAPFVIKLDLLQLIPHTSSKAKIVGDQCVPPINTGPGAPPTTVQGAVFREGGFRVAWDMPIEAEYRGGEPPELPDRYLRVYRHTGDPYNPLADITCATYQVITGEIDPPSTRHIVAIWYKPHENQGFQKLPGGEYQICTFDRAGSQLRSACATSRYPVLRTAMTGPIERNPPVPPEFFVITVPTSLGSGLLCEHGTCMADMDDGSSTGTPDDGVTIDDLLYYLMVFEAGHPCADVDDGSSTGTTDGGVTIDDLLYYLFRFEAGC